jgi:hypothetical protein
MIPSDRGRVIDDHFPASAKIPHINFHVIPATRFIKDAVTNLISKVLLLLFKDYHRSLKH